MANRVDKSHWDHNCGDRIDVEAIIVMTQPADLPILSREGKAFLGRIYRTGNTATAHETAEYAAFSDAVAAVDRWLAENPTRLATGGEGPGH